MSKNVLIIGSGGREHAIGTAVAGNADKVFFAPGNPGTTEVGENLEFGPSWLGHIGQFACEGQCDLVIVGPEVPLAQGIADHIRKYDVPTFGPGYEGAKLESSKAFSAEFLEEFGIPHPQTHLAGSYQQAMDVVSKDVTNWVLKTDKLAAGKGVVLPDTLDEAKNILHGTFSGELFNGAGRDMIVIQERLHGPELTVTAVTDGKGNVVLLPYSRDHKRLKDKDKGPNTGGMGAYAPVKVRQNQRDKIWEIVEKTIYGIQQRKIDYRGALYVGVMFAKEYNDDPVVLEYNVRFGDPEAQVLLPVLRQTNVNVYDMLYSAAEGHLDEKDLSRPAGRMAVTVCLAVEGYPDKPVTGETIKNLDRKYPGVEIYHGSTRQDNDRVVTAGGRVLWLTGLGSDAKNAARKVYSAIGKGKGGIYFDGMQYRKDIGSRPR